MSKKLVKISLLLMGLVSTAIIGKIGMNSSEIGNSSDNFIDTVHADVPGPVDGPVDGPSDGPCDGGPCDA